MMFDAVVIGAGINGCGIALELCRRGRRVVVVDKGSVGGGTSSKSSRLIHGGLRYLEQFRFGLVREALRDRAELLRTYPDLVQLEPFYLPVYDDSPRAVWKIGAGVRLYDFLSGRNGTPSSSRVSNDAFGQTFPSIDTKRLRAVFRYYDGKTDDLELTCRVANDARTSGCEVLEQTVVKSIAWDSGCARVETSAGVLDARAVVNATGPWIDEVNERLDLRSRFTIRKVSGIHLFFDGLLTPHPLFLQIGPRRIFFVIPELENGQTMIGTTEREEPGSIDDVTVTDVDVGYLIDAVNAYLRPEATLEASGVTRATIGVRPLVSSREDPTDLSREYELDLHERDGVRLLHVFGGKLTTYLSLSRKAADILRM